VKTLREISYKNDEKSTVDEEHDAFGERLGRVLIVRCGNESLCCY